MKRTECELAIAEHLKAISDLYREYMPNGERLNVTCYDSKNGNGNDVGNWGVREIYVEGDEIGFELWLDIDDDRYRYAMGDDYEKPEWNYNKGKWGYRDSDYE